MSAVFMFNHSDKDILEELLKVFNGARGTAREQWTLEAEVLVEPAGWDALWKLSKEYCKKFNVRFPCIAVVTVASVDFEGLSACVELLGVQHENIVLPDTVEDVPLIELWPTINQREECVNAATTAEFIDLLRFYYNNIWMPWDDQDEKVVLPNTIVERMGLWSDLHNGKIPGPVALTISSLKAEAIKAHKKLKELDSSLCSEDLVDEDDSMLPPSYILTCAEMHAKLDSLMSQWTMYENPLIREQNLANFKSKWHRDRNKKNVVALWKGGDLKEFEKISQFLKLKLSSGQKLSIMTSAEEGLASTPEEVVFCSDVYEIPDIPLSHISMCSYKGCILKATDIRSSLLMASEECRLRDLTLCCSSVSTVVIVRSGSTQIIDCTLLDDSKQCQDEFSQGIVAMANSKVLVENCTFENFYSGVIVYSGAQVELRNCTITRCGVGIQMFGNAKVTLNRTTIDKCLEQSIRCELNIDEASKSNGLVDGLTIQPNCKIGSGDLKKEVKIVEQQIDLI